MYDKHPEMKFYSSQPFNVGSIPRRLREQFITPNELFFVRTHGNIPHISADSYALTIDGMVKTPLYLSLQDLREKFSSHTVTATLNCAGNRRKELESVAPIAGEILWGSDAVSTAVWRGVSLIDVLEAARLQASAAHIAFTGLDEVQKNGHTFGFGGSIPLEKAQSKDVLLAYEMNGETLPLAHGYPLRVIVPGAIGARSVKWLANITVQDKPSENFYQANAYKLFPGHVRPETANWEEGVMLGDLPLNSMISCPSNHELRAGGAIQVSGFAIPSAGNSIKRVELSADGGITWQDTELTSENHQWAWRFWQAEVNLPRGRHELVVRAHDTSGLQQPENVASIWNFKGYLNNAWHRVTIQVL